MIVTQGNIFLIVRIFTRKCVFVCEIFCTFCKNILKNACIIQNNVVYLHKEKQLKHLQL